MDVPKVSTWPGYLATYLLYYREALPRWRVLQYLQRRELLIKAFSCPTYD